MSSELGRIERLRQIYKWTAKPLEGIVVGIGDDAAVLRPSEGAEPLVWTIDAQVEGRHFRRDWLSLEDIGFRAFMAAASDLAAMGADPWSALSSLAVPSELTDEDLDALARGTQAAAEIVGAPIVGGNLTGGSELAITTTLLGRAARPLTRSGAAEGDGLWLAGAVGLAAAGFRALSTNRQMDHESVRPALLAWRRPRALILEGRGARSAASAAIDVSDGLSQDVMHLATASGLGAVLDEDALLIGALVRAARAIGADPLDLALFGGEDYALVVASRSPIEGFSRIGELTKAPGLRIRSRRGERAIEAHGFDHFALSAPPALK